MDPHVEDPYHEVGHRQVGYVNISARVQTLVADDNKHDEAVANNSHQYRQGIECDFQSGLPSWRVGLVEHGRHVLQCISDSLVVESLSRWTRIWKRRKCRSVVIGPVQLAAV